MRRHGWQLPLHPLQFVGTAVFILLVSAFYVFLGPFLGNRIVENTALTLFSFSAISVTVLYVRCTAIDPTDRTDARKRRGPKSGKLPRINYRHIFCHIVVRFLRKLEDKILSCCIRRNYLEQWNSSIQLEPLLPFPLVVTDDAVSPHQKGDDISFCALCDFELIIEGGTAVAIFIRCFADSKGMEQEMVQKLRIKFPKGVLAAISISLALLTGYSTAALGQLFFFHVVLIRKGMRTYDYILAMREESQLMDPFDDTDSSSDESIDFDSPDRPPFLSRFLCRRTELSRSARRLSIRIEREPNAPNKKVGFEINPWKLIKMSKGKAMIAAERARERIRRNLPHRLSPMKPLPLETKQGPLVNSARKHVKLVSEITPVVTKAWFAGSPSKRFSSPRRRISGSPSPGPQKYRTNFDLKLTEVSRELENHISKQMLCSIMAKDGEDEASPTK
uniref:S-acyltransferase n=1 Tax=Ananas comosus var. bracteatus TaxID=296719 RepID=A0A6V7NEH5_ANACO|nr:unnamed protein product [Ananas comosus var. bracteatus]